MTEPKTVYKDWIDKIINQWKSKGIKLNDGISTMNIREAEMVLDFKFPDTFIELYKRVNGFADWDSTSDWFSISPINKILENFSNEGDNIFIPFCDYSINLYFVGFVKGEEGIYKSFDQINPVATSFENAIELITSGSKLLYS